jgi:type I restriction enzyme M protein
MTHRMEYSVKQLLDRNSTPLATLAKSVDDLRNKLSGHSKVIGLEWSL